MYGSILFQFLCLLICMAMNDDEFTLKPRKIKFKQRLNSTTTYINSTNSVHCMLNEFIVLGSSYLFKPLCVIFCQAFLF